MKRREVVMIEEEVSVYRKFWKVYKNKIYDILVLKINWNNLFKKVFW